MRACLSGGMEYATGEGRLWREEMEIWLAGELGWESFNPNRESERFLASRIPGVPFRSLKTGDPALFLSVVAEIVEMDSKDVAERADCVICYWDDGAMKGAGTKGELTIARYFKKPVYLVTTIPLVEIPGWVLGCVTKMFGSFDELKAHLLKTHRASRD